ncbi:hypothetical protein BV22DRAFT_1200355 [Leucogyrophana mollusca]|uniref:Uncharacterized protein n=1 Tax=Leucogyrophana mollusca TaxID=85980 RepID=A0ACB8AU86_9AGAM|nr:hypothetical protein BV22DRAFT_1200355 [Leucogyrophana mollusca]
MIEPFAARARLIPYDLSERPAAPTARGPRAGTAPFDPHRGSARGLLLPQLAVPWAPPLLQCTEVLITLDAPALHTSSHQYSLRTHAEELDPLQLFSTYS